MVGLFLRGCLLHSLSEFDVLLAMDGSMPSGLKVVLFVLIAFLLVILGVLACLAFVIRRRPTAAQRKAAAQETGDDVVSDLEEPMPMMHAVSIGSVEGLAVAADSSLACPTCRREYEGDLQFCPNDARRLIPSSEMLDRSRSGGSVCPRCQRAFDPGVRFCPHDAAELVPVSIYEITRNGKREPSPTGILAKICPQCRKRYDLAATFCGKDGSELKTVN